MRDGRGIDGDGWEVNVFVPGANRCQKAREPPDECQTLLTSASGLPLPLEAKRGPCPTSLAGWNGAPPSKKTRQTSNNPPTALRAVRAISMSHAKIVSPLFRDNFCPCLTLSEIVP